MYFADPWYVPDEDEHLMNEPHGYLTNDDVNILKSRICFQELNYDSFLYIND